MIKKDDESNNSVKFMVDKEVYPIASIMKTAYIFIEKYYLYINIENDKVVVEMKLKYDSQQIDERDVGEFYNELLNQALRLDISRKTKNIREIIMARALFQTCIENDDLINAEQDEGYNIDNIAMDWFYKNEAEI